MIVINSGKMTIPEEERFIGFAGDNLHSTKQFLLTGIDEQNCIYRLYLTFDDGTTNYFVLDSKVVDGSTLLTWNIETGHIFKSGTVKAQIKSIADDGEIYHTNSDFFLVGHTAEFNPSFKDTENSEFLEYEKKLNELIKRLEVGLNEVVPTSRKIADIDLKNDITATELQKSLQTYPVLTLLEKTPTEETVGEEKQLLVSFKDGEYLFYICVNKIGEGDTAKYDWRLLNEKPDLSNYVQKGTKIAELNLKDDISKSQLGNNLVCRSISNTERIGEDFEGRIAIIDSGSPSFSFEKAYILGAIQSDAAGWVELLTSRNIKTQVDKNSSNSQVPSAKLFYDTIGGIENLLEALL